ncbi:MAG: sugar kinase [Syntrophobacterales bacterium]|nr:sugar kinase [Syntrophobacterales bacterium]
MLTVVGTIPYPDVPVVTGVVESRNGIVTIGDRVSFHVQRCTLALLTAAYEVIKYFRRGAIRAVLAGDAGKGDGSQAIYRYIVENPKTILTDVLVFHCLFPDVDWHIKIVMAIEPIKGKTLIVADAGFMYVAKMSGQASFYDLFTPDIGELAFLADEEAPHPFYTRGFIIHEEDNVPALIKRAYLHENAARNLLVKASTDYIVLNGQIAYTVSEPNVPELEAIGGTGDTLTGIVSALLDVGFDLPQAMLIGSRTNRLAGSIGQLTVDTSISNLIANIGLALEGQAIKPVPKEFSITLGIHLNLQFK